MFTILDYSSALEYSIIRRYTNIVYYYYYYYYVLFLHLFLTVSATMWRFSILIWQYYFISVLLLLVSLEKKRI